MVVIYLPWTGNFSLLLHGNATCRPTTSTDPPNVVVRPIFLFYFFGGGGVRVSFPQSGARASPPVQRRRAGDGVVWTWETAFRVFVRREEN
jgi:hypothetical protein